MSGVDSKLSFASLLAPTEIRYSTTSRWPFSDAKMSGVDSLWFFTSLVVYVDGFSDFFCYVYI